MTHGPLTVVVMTALPPACELYHVYPYDMLAGLRSWAHAPRPGYRLWFSYLALEVSIVMRSVFRAGGPSCPHWPGPPRPSL